MGHLFSLLVKFRQVTHGCCLSVWDLLLWYLSAFLRQRISAALVPLTLPSIAMSFPSDLAVLEFHGGLRPGCASSVIGRGFAAPGKVGADPPPLACALALTFSFGSDGSRWFSRVCGVQ